MESPFMNAEQLAAYLNTSVKHLKEVAKRRPQELPPRFSRPGQPMMWHRDDVTAWVERRRKESRARELSRRPWAGSTRSAAF